MAKHVARMQSNLRRQWVVSLEIRVRGVDEVSVRHGAHGAGYIANPSSTGDCQFCQYSVGQSFYTPLELDFDTRGRDISIYFCYIVFNILCLLLAARFLRYSKR